MPTVNGNAFKTEYVALNRQYTLTTPLNRKSVITTDEQGRNLAQQSGSLHALRYDYDARSRMASVSQGRATKNAVAVSSATRRATPNRSPMR